MRGVVLWVLLFEAACSTQRAPTERVAKVVYVDVKQDAAAHAAPSSAPDAAAPAIPPGRPAKPLDGR